jgi:hypothetical protein
MARAPSSPIRLSPKLHNITCNIHYTLHHNHGPEYHIHRIWWMPYSLYIGYCRIDLERFRNGSRSFVSNTITLQAAKYDMQHTLHLHYIIIWLNLCNVPYKVYSHYTTLSRQCVTYILRSSRVYCVQQPVYLRNLIVVLVSRHFASSHA